MRTFSLGFGLAVSVLSLAGPTGAVNVRDHRSPSVSAGAYAQQASSIFELALTVLPGQTKTCETRNLTGGVDPVLHILRQPAGDGPVTEVARDDDSGGALNAKVSFRAPFFPGPLLLVLRSSGRGGPGTADLFCDGRLVWPKIAVGGAFKRLENLDARESLRTIVGPGGPGVHTLFLLDDDGKILARYRSGPADSAVVSGGLTGLRIALMGGKWPDPTGELRLIRNDNQIPGHDPDGDGLGTLLEAAIGTCSSKSDIALGFDCSRVADPRDTDGDGLQDGLELFGKLTAAPYQHLPRWGADPRHKDVFIEVDFGLAATAEAPQKMNPVQVANFRALYGDPETDPVLQLLHAQQLVNPDGKPGVNTHLDIGLDPPANSPVSILTSYGDWGGYSVIQPVCSNGTCTRASAASVYQTMMDPARRGIFHYALGDPGGGGQAGIGIALNFPEGAGVSAAHEFGHTLGLNHEGQPPGVNCTPAYPSIMNYAFQYANGAGFSDGFGRSAVNDMTLHEAPGVANPASLQGQRLLRDLRDVFGLTVDVTSGNVDWNRDGIYAPGVSPAYASYAPNAAGGCEVTRDSMMTAQGLSDVAPALVHISRKTALIYIDESNRKLRMEVSNTALNCPKLMADCGGMANRAINEAWNKGIVSVDAATIANLAGGEQVLVVFRTAAGLFETSFGPGFTWAAPKAIATTQPAIGEISLTGKGQRAWLSYRSGSGAAFVKSRNLAGAWSTDERVADTTGAFLDVAPGAAPGLLLLTDNTGTERLLGAFPLQPTGGLALYERPPGGGPWTKFAVQPSAQKVFGRPAVAAQPAALGSPLPARITILYVRLTGATGNIVMQSNLIADHVGPGAQLKWVTAQHDNVWFFGNGVDLLFEPGADTNLRAAVSTALIEHDQPSAHHVVLRPKADGVVDFDQKNFSDWEMIGRSLCLRLKENSAQVNCPS